MFALLDQDKDIFITASIHLLAVAIRHRRRGICCLDRVSCSLYNGCFPFRISDVWWNAGRVFLILTMVLSRTASSKVDVQRERGRPVCMCIVLSLESMSVPVLPTMVLYIYIYIYIYMIASSRLTEKRTLPTVFSFPKYCSFLGGWILQKKEDGWLFWMHNSRCTVTPDKMLRIR